MLLVGACVGDVVGAAARGCACVGGAVLVLVVLCGVFVLVLVLLFAYATDGFIRRDGIGGDRAHACGVLVEMLGVVLATAWISFPGNGDRHGGSSTD